MRKSTGRLQILCVTVSLAQEGGSELPAACAPVAFCAAAVVAAEMSFQGPRISLWEAGEGDAAVQERERLDSVAKNAGLPIPSAVDYVEIYNFDGWLWTDDGLAPPVPNGPTGSTTTGLDGVPPSKEQLLATQVKAAS